MTSSEEIAGVQIALVDAVERATHLVVVDTLAAPAAHVRLDLEPVVPRDKMLPP